MVPGLLAPRYIHTDALSAAIHGGRRRGGRLKMEFD